MYAYAHQTVRAICARTHYRGVVRARVVYALKAIFFKLKVNMALHNHCFIVCGFGEPWCEYARRSCMRHVSMHFVAWRDERCSQLQRCSTFTRVVDGARTAKLRMRSTDSGRGPSWHLFRPHI